MTKGKIKDKRCIYLKIYLYAHICNIRHRIKLYFREIVPHISVGSGPHSGLIGICC